jgi:hypothetical protein
MYLDKDAILNSLTKEDVKKIVMELGSLEPKEDSNGNYIFQTICHNQPSPDNSWKLYYYHEPSDQYKGRTFHCFSQDGDSFNIVELVIRAYRTRGKTITWYRALKYIGQITGKLSVISADEIDTRNNQLIDDFEWINRLKSLKKNKREIPKLTEIDENILDIFCYYPHEEWLNDHISREALSRYEIGYYGLTNQITIPHRDKDNRLIGIRGRFLDQEDIDNIGKYVPLNIEGHILKHSLGSNLYGINVTQNKIKRIKKAMLVESEKGCMQAYSYFGNESFVIATCGSNITASQQKLLLEYLQVEEVIVGFDREYHAPDSYEAEIYYNKLIKKVAPLVPYCKVSLCLDTKDRLPYKKSPTDMGSEILLELLDEKIPITMEEVNRVLRK